MHINRSVWVGLLALGVARAIHAQETPPEFRAPRDLFAQAVRPTAARPLEPDTVVAKVNAVAITWSQLEREVRRVMGQLAPKIRPDQQAVAQAEVTRNLLDGLIARHLLLQAADEMGIQVAEQEVQQVREQIRSQLGPGQTLDSVLSSQGITTQDFDENLTKDLRIAKLLTQIAGNAKPPSDEEVARFYAEHEQQMIIPERAHVRHILIRSSEDEPTSMRADKKARAEAIRKKLLEGADFAAMVREHSEDADSVARGGEYVLARGQMVPPFEHAAFTQPTNEIGPVVETTFGFHIIQVLGREEARKRTLEEVAPQIREVLLNQERQRLINEFIRARRETSKVDVFVSF